MMLQKMMILGSIAKMKLRDLFTDEKGEVNIVAIVILIGIAAVSYTHLNLFYIQR